LNSDRVRHFAHDAAECIDFPDEMSFSDAAYRGIARHLRDQVDVERVERGLETHARTGQGRLTPRVPRSDDDNIELFGELHGSSILQVNMSGEVSVAFLCETLRFLW
jgi:hypothetical protein